MEFRVCRVHEKRPSHMCPPQIGILIQVYPLYYDYAKEELNTRLGKVIFFAFEDNKITVFESLTQFEQSYDNDIVISDGRHIYSSQY